MEYDKKEYERLFKKYYIALLRYCNKILHDRDIAEDVTEETFIKVWNKWNELESEQNMKAFAYLCARNACFNINERKGKMPHCPVELHQDSIIFEMSIDFDIIESEVLSFIYKEIEKLPQRQKETIKLYLMGLTTYQVKEKLNCSIKTALNQKLKVIARLKNSVNLRYG